MQALCLTVLSGKSGCLSACAQERVLVSQQGVKKTKLGLREFVKLGDFLQTIDIDSCTAVRQMQGYVAGHVCMVWVHRQGPVVPAWW
jgi:hypothetical protein